MVILTLRDEVLQVLLVKRKVWPYKNRWALPGGFVRMKESLEQAAIRELYEETHVKDVYLEQLYTFGNPKRDPRTRVITVAYCALVRSEDLRLSADTDVSDVRWFPVPSLPRPAFDHGEILNYAVARLQNKLLYTNIAFQLLPDLFTLTELQNTYAAILGKPVDKRNFRKKILSSGVLEETSSRKQDGRHRPARLYRFVKEKELEGLIFPKKR
ncbi:MAG: NUDIX hydrolase [Armatimonadetes bacterium]|nr:NUDIX hydrolase [Armatimonadota bacterium]